MQDEDEPVIITCPSCNAHIDDDEASEHWLTHVRPIVDDPARAGQFTYDCVCEPTGMVWPDADSARAGLALHMQGRHNILI